MPPQSRAREIYGTCSMHGSLLLRAITVAKKHRNFTSQTQGVQHIIDTKILPPERVPHAITVMISGAMLSGGSVTGLQIRFRPRDYHFTVATVGLLRTIPIKDTATLNT